MTAYLSFEWLKLTRRWMPRIILLLVATLTVLVFWGQGSRIDRVPDVVLPRAWLAALLFSAFFAPFFWPVLGGSWAGNEYGWGTIRTVLTRRPHRVEHILSALVILIIALGIALLAILLVASATALVVAALTGYSTFTSGILDSTFVVLLVKGFLAAWFVSAFYMLLAYAAATIFRSAAVGIGVGIGATLAQFVLFGILSALGSTWKHLTDYFPVNYTQNLVLQVVHSGMLPGRGLSSVDPGTPSAGACLLGLAIYSAVLTGLMIIAVRARDVTA